jgi:DNA-binding response OmpR family regulator
MHVLLVENTNLASTESLSSNLEAQGHCVWLAHTPASATQQTVTIWPNLIIFHPGQDLLDVAGFQQAINETKLNIPQIVVGGENQLRAEVSSDTILVAPDKPQQLRQSMLKATAKQKGRFLRFPNLTVDCVQHQVLRHDKVYPLTPKEFKLLHLLIENRNQILTRKIIMQKVWETDYMGDTRTLDVHIRWLREKIEDNPSRPERLVTIRGVGYRFVVDLVSE